MANTSSGFVLRPGVTNPRLWYPERPPEKDWDRIRKSVLVRDDYTCIGCGHRAVKYMNVHHIDETGLNTPENLTTVCVACHAVVHMGRNVDMGVIQIWRSPVSQVEIVQRTRDGVRRGQTLDDINKQFNLKPGEHSPTSLEYANELIDAMDTAPRAYLPEPLCAVFVNLKRWQLE